MKNKHIPRRLNVVKITLDELQKHWGFVPVLFNPKDELFIRSNRRAEINWDVAPVYTWNEIVKEQQRKRQVCFLVPREVFELPESP